MSKNDPAIGLMSLDTAKACNTPFMLELKHPTTGAPLNMFIPVLGKDSDVFREHIKSSMDAKNRRDSLAARRGKPPEIQRSDEQEQESIELLTVCIAESGQQWKNIRLTDNGPELEFNVKNIKETLGIIWVRRQVDEAIGDLENFMQS